jgi:hypothetical protein
MGGVRVILLPVYFKPSKITTMKQLIFLVLFLFSMSAFAQNVGINDDGSSPDASALLDVNSTAGDKGFLMPRLTEAQRNLIASPATGLIIYQTDNVPGFYHYNGANWVKLSNERITYATVAEAEAATGIDNDLCYVVETETHYRYEASGSGNTDDNEYVLSTGDGGNTRWVGIAGRFNLGDISLQDIIHLDASGGSATITDLNKIYYITTPATPSAATITIPDANAGNEGWYLRLFKEGGQGLINVQTTSGQSIDGDNPAIIRLTGNGMFIKSDNSTQWLLIEDSRLYQPSVITTTVDYNAATDDWSFDYLQANTSSSDITVTLPASITHAPDGQSKFFFNVGSNRVFFNTNGNSIDGSSSTRIIAPEGYIELQKVDGSLKIIREKNISIKKCADDISNLVCWLDASQLSGTDGSSLATWADSYGSVDFTAAGVNQPTLYTNVQNGKNIVRFDGSNDVMSAGDVEVHDNTRGLTIVAVVKPTGSGRRTIIGKYNTAGDNREYAFGNGDSYLFEAGDWNGATYTTVAMQLNSFQIVEYIWEPGGVLQVYINGVLHARTTTNINDIYNGTANLKIGCPDYTYAGYWMGDIAEVAIYSDAVASSEREYLRQNLAVKWDIDEVIISGSGGGNYWTRDDNTNTISPDVDNDNIDIGTGEYAGGAATIDTVRVSTMLNNAALSSSPGNAQAGSMYYDTNVNKLKVYNGSAWEALSTGTESDPVYSAAPASGITTTNINNWNNGVRLYSSGTGTSVSFPSLSIGQTVMIYARYNNGATSTRPYLRVNGSATNSDYYSLCENYYMFGNSSSPTVYQINGTSPGMELNPNGDCKISDMELKITRTQTGTMINGWVYNDSRSYARFAGIYNNTTAPSYIQIVNGNASYTALSVTYKVYILP